MRCQEEGNEVLRDEEGRGGSFHICNHTLGLGVQMLVVLPQSGPEPWFEPDFWSGSPRFGPWFLHQLEPDWKTVLGSSSSQTVQFWFSLPEPFRTLIDFDFDNICLDIRLSSSGFTLLINQATFSLFEDYLLLEVDILGAIKVDFGGIVSCTMLQSTKRSAATEAERVRVRTRKKPNWTTENRSLWSSSGFEDFAEPDHGPVLGSRPGPSEPDQTGPRQH
ncbi:uncharacterized protein F5147DRAFT_657605 [Suillus discolor]|uniref:Uncharacterized protein n=1 Tax=Suillus discolor TaxID=1912936 RepID=A0A9P7EWZ1_9AGAM|nr:uncharacterized protein F5147DRAFT_657605 [Suillus discolor]KAG2092827.1 hypothetical protein F5147DRAFT_657605 [Suillus discolor]